MKNHILILFIICFNSFSYSQGWEQTLGTGDCDESGYYVQTTEDGGYIVSGKTDQSAYLAKTDSYGLIEWDITYGNELYNSANKVSQTSDGEYLLTIESHSQGYDYYETSLVKITNQGVIIWEKTFPNIETSKSEASQHCSNGDIVLIGTNHQNNNSDIWLVRIDSEGNEIWSLTYENENSNEQGTSVIETNNQELILLSHTTNLDTQFNDVVITKTDNLGGILWSYEFGSQSYDENGYSLLETSTGGYVVSGSISDNENTDLWLLSVNNNGEEIFNLSFGESNKFENGRSIREVSDGTFIITGHYRDENLDTGVLLSKHSTNGDQLWSHIHTSPSFYLSGTCIQETNDYGLIVTGWKVDYLTFCGNIYLLKTDSNGTLTTPHVITTLSQPKLVKIVDILGREVNFSTNQILFYIYENGLIEKKLSTEL